MLCIGSFTSAAQAQDRTEDEQAIQKVLADFVAPWNQHDMKLWSELFTDDADFIVVTANHLKGRDEIFKYHDELHKGPFKDHQMKASWQDVRFLHNDVAIGHVKFEPGNDKMKRTALATAVLLKHDGRWLITAFHNTLLYGPPLPEQFPPNSKGGASTSFGHTTLTSPSFLAARRQEVILDQLMVESPSLKLRSG